jgi:DNA-binding transcriptional MerR regulator
MLTIGQLARRCGMSRTALLYYEELGLLAPASRSAAGYRRYGERECQRAERIRDYRATGLSLAQIEALLASGDATPAIAQRLQAIQDEMARLREQQAVLIRLLTDGQQARPTWDKAGWTAMLRKAGLDEAAMARWHALFEQQSPAAHDAFLRSLGLKRAEVTRIRDRARGFGV